MISNFYIPWQIPCTQTSFDQYVINLMIYNQFYPGTTYYEPSYFSNKIQQTLMQEGNLQNCCEKIILEEDQEEESEQFQGKSVKNGSEIEEGKQQNDEGKTRQKYGRNITSNIFRSMLKRLSSSNRFKKLFYRIVEQRKLNISYESFLDLIDKLSYKLKSYVKRNEMRRFIVPEGGLDKREQFCLVFRTMARVYLREEHVVSIFYSKKINKQSRKLHFVLLREMEALLK